MTKTKAQTEAEVARLNKRIRDNNYRFRKLSDAQKRVRIAKDVIKNIESGKLEAANEGYLVLPDRLRQLFNAKDYYEWQADDESLSKSERRRATRWLARADEALETPLHVVFDRAPSCTVCAIGACFVSAVLRTDGAKVKDLYGPSDHDGMREYLDEYFPLSQLGLIEAAFEGDEFFGTKCGASTTSSERAESFGDEYPDPEDRMLAIMRNIIEHDGTFKP